MYIFLPTCAMEERLHLETNVLESSIPSEVGLLKNITVIKLTDNRMTGSIPTEIGLLRGLVSEYNK